MGRNAAAGVIFSPISPGLFLHSLNNWKQLTPDGLHILVKNSCSNPYVKNKVDMTNVCHNWSACQSWWWSVSAFWHSAVVLWVTRIWILACPTSLPFHFSTILYIKKKQVRYAAAVWNHKSCSRSRQVVLGEVEGFRGTGALQDQLTANIVWEYLNVKQAIDYRISRRQ